MSFSRAPFGHFSDYKNKLAARQKAAAATAQRKVAAPAAPAPAPAAPAPEVPTKPLSQIHSSPTSPTSKSRHTSPIPRPRSTSVHSSRGSSNRNTPIKSIRTLDTEEQKIPNLPSFVEEVTETNEEPEQTKVDLIEDEREPEEITEKTPSTKSQQCLAEKPQSTPVTSLPAAKLSARSAMERQNRRVLESQFITKRKRYAALKKELTEKQRLVTETYTSLKDIRERVLSSGGRDLGIIEEIKLMEIGHSKQATKKEGCKQGQGSGEDISHHFDAITAMLSEKSPELVKWVSEKMDNMLNPYLELCSQTMTKRNDVVAWFVQVVSGQEMDNEFRQQLQSIQMEGDNFDKQLEEVKREQLHTTTELLGAIRCLTDEHEKMKHEHEKMLQKVDEMQKYASSQQEATQVQEVHPNTEEYKQHIEELEGHITELNQELGTLQNKATEMQAVIADLESRVTCANEEVVTEREKNKHLVDKMSSQDVHLKSTRQRLREMEGKLSADENRIQQLNNQMRIIEEQLRIKDVTFDHKMKDMSRTAKATSDLVNQLEKQREALEIRIEELTSQLVRKEGEASVVIGDLQSRLDLSEQQVQHEVDLRKALQTEMQYEKKHSTQFEEDNNRMRDIIKMAQTDAKEEEERHTKKEQEMWAEIQSTKSVLQAAKVQISVLEEEKASLLDSLKKSTRSDEESMQCRSAELAQKDEIITHLKSRVEQMGDAATKSQEQILKHERQLSELKAQLLEKSSSEVSSKERNVRIVELEHQVGDLQATVSEVVHNNEQLEYAVLQKQGEMEQRERVMREQGKVLKVRDELIGLLKAKEQRLEEQLQALQTSIQDRDKTTDKVREVKLLAMAVNKEVAAKADELQGLYQTLENKQLHVIRLEKVVKQLEEQQDRSQAQRTRHEARIAQLEMALQTQRGRKFPFL